MKKILAALALLLGTATPAMSQVSPYAEATAASSFKGDVDYGLNVGAATTLNPNLRLLTEVGAENFADGSQPTTLNASLGLNTDLAGPFSLYGKVGYLNRDGDSGYRLATGINARLTRNLYGTLGVRRDDYGSNPDVAGTVGLGFRF